jgi:rubrerythrin
MTTNMTDKQVRLLMLFKQAIQGEQDAQRLYTEMMDHTDDPELKRIIESFRSSEKKHEAELLKKYAELRKSGNFKD